MVGHSTVISAQIRAARAMLHISAQHLAKETGLGISTIQRMENRGTNTVTRANLKRVIQFLEERGIMFLGPLENGSSHGEGVYLKADSERQNS